MEVEAGQYGNPCTDGSGATKNKYTKKEAKRAAKHERHNDFYQCPQCDFYHLTKPKRFKL